MKMYSKPTLSIVNLQPKETIANGTDNMLRRPMKQYVTNNSQCGKSWTYYDLSQPRSGGPS